MSRRSLLGASGSALAFFLCSGGAEADQDFDHQIDANRIQMVVTNVGSFAYNLEQGAGGLRYPAGTDKTALFAGGIFLGGLIGGELRVSAAEYAFSFAPGPMLDGSAQPDHPNFRIYQIDELSGIGDPDFDAWPVGQGAPVDSNGRPLLRGSQTLWSVYNDDSDRSSLDFASANPLGVSIQQTAWAYRYPGALDNTIFLEYQIRNHGPSPIEDFYLSMWSDPDIGSASGVLGGCSPRLDLGYAYKEAGFEDPLYGSAAPAVGFTLLQTPLDGAREPLGLTSYLSYINGTDPQLPQWAFHYMRGLLQTGEPVIDPTTNEPTSFWYAGDPVAGTGWLNDNGVNRKTVTSTGPFVLEPGESETIVVALIVGQGTDHLGSVSVLHDQVAEIRARFRDQNFPRLLEVHPGDLDADGVVGADDVLALAISWGETGPARTKGSLAFTGQPVLSWPSLPATYADGNGDGRVDMADLFAIGINWSRHHPIREPIDPPAIDLTLLRHRLIVIRDALRDDPGEFAGAARERIEMALATSPDPDPALVTAAPNPFQQGTTLSYRIQHPTRVRTWVVDALGRRVFSGSGRELEPGVYEEFWNGNDAQGRSVPDGTYWIVLETGFGKAATRVVHRR